MTFNFRLKNKGNGGNWGGIGGGKWGILQKKTKFIKPVKLGYY